MKLIKIFTGPESLAMLISKRLEETGFPSLIKNDSMTAYLGTAPLFVDLYIDEADMEKAGPLIDEIIAETEG
jgi:hypothetical protein